MTLDEVLAAAHERANVMRQLESKNLVAKDVHEWVEGFLIPAQAADAKFRAAILSYGRAERERAAVEALKHTTHPDDPNNEVWQCAYNHVANECASAIRSLPDEASPSVAQGVAA